MNLLFKKVKIFHPGAPFHLQQKDILLQNGSVTSIGEDLISDHAEVIEETGLCVSGGWFDMYAEISEPGNESVEDLQSSAAAAAAGGFTNMLCFAASEPAIQTKNTLLFIKDQTAAFPVHFHCSALATVNAEGKDLTEMLDLAKFGAVAFSDGYKSVQHSEVLLKALTYLQQTDTVLINRAENTKLNERGQMHEGITSTKLGLPGMPALAEILNLSRDLEILDFNGGRLHVPFVSTAASVQKIREAKEKGLNVTCGIATYQLAFTDEEIISFDTNYKVNPPFRSKKDRAALIEGLLDGTIDVLVSGHRPQDTEAKNLEFDLAAFGIINSETAFSVARTFAPELPLEVLLEKIVSNPRKILKVVMPEIKEGATADLTFFQPDEKWVYTKEEVKSKSRNSPFFDLELTGKVFGIVNKGVFVRNEKQPA